jgi:hypothetical protein
MEQIDPPDRIALWVVPRSVSTAFERVFIERKDTTVIHEPFGVYYYNSKERRNERHIKAYPPQPEYEFDHIMNDKILKPHDNALWFMKDMPYHVTSRMTADFAKIFRNTFLIRKPEDAISSHYNLAPDLTIEEAGYPDQKRFFNISMNECNEPPIVVDADDFRTHPESIMRQYCDRLGIAHKPEAMQWEKKEIDIWKISESWHKDAIVSTHIIPPQNKNNVELPTRIKEMIEECQEYYREMFQYRILPSTNL